MQWVQPYKRQKKRKEKKIVGWPGQPITYQWHLFFEKMVHVWDPELGSQWQQL